MFTVERIAKRVVFLDQGKVHFDGTPKELYASDDPQVMRFLERYRTKVN
jgi:ABC-type transporter Mla maintaining outer membrane lipid asymmetry ATPase subunit MlaF